MNEKETKEKECAEMQKAADAADILGHFWAILAILGHFWANLGILGNFL